MSQKQHKMVPAQGDGEQKAAILNAIAVLESERGVKVKRLPVYSLVNTVLHDGTVLKIGEVGQVTPYWKERLLQMGYVSEPVAEGMRPEGQ